MSGMTAPIEVAVVYGYGQVYFSLEGQWLGGWPYLLFSMVLFLIFTDTCIYWIHRSTILHSNHTSPNHHIPLPAPPHLTSPHHTATQHKTHNTHKNTQENYTYKQKEE